MQIMPIDITGLVATVLGISIVLIPVIGLTARFALQPTVEALSRLFDHKGLGDNVRLLEKRIDLQEQHMESMEASLRRIAAVSEFHHSLDAGSSAESESPAAVPDDA